jgi:hypothetical protein
MSRSREVRVSLGIVVAEGSMKRRQRVPGQGETGMTCLLPREALPKRLTSTYTRSSCGRIYELEEDVNLTLLPLSLGIVLLAGGPASAQYPPSPPAPRLPSVHVQIVQTEPPPFRQDVVLARPGPDHVWTDGSWDYGRSGWVWVDGRWTRPPARQAHWVKAEYVRVDRGWRYVPAHWSHQRVVVDRSSRENGRHRGWTQREHRRGGRD